MKGTHLMMAVVCAANLASCDWIPSPQGPAPPPTSEDFSPVESPRPAPRSKEEDPCTFIRRIFVSSSAIRSIGYCSEGRVLEVEFVRHSVYRYFDVPVGVYREFLGASSHGRYLNQVLKPAGFRYRRIQ